DRHRRARGQHAHGPAAREPEAPGLDRQRPLGAHRLLREDERRHGRAHPRQLPGRGRGRVPHRHRRPRRGGNQGVQEGRSLARRPRLLGRSCRHGRPPPGDRGRADERREQRGVLAREPQHPGDAGARAGRVPAREVGGSRPGRGRDPRRARGAGRDAGVVTSAASRRRHVAVGSAAAGIALSCCLALAAPAPPAKSTKPAASKPAAKAPIAKAGESAKPIDIATRARVFEEQGAYASALAELQRLRSVQGPDPDVELAIALDEARVGLLDSAWTRLYSPILERALADSAGDLRRSEYPFQRESMWVNGTFDGWYWYIARARAELALARRDWPRMLGMASRASAARPLSGKEALLVALAAGHTGDEEYSEAAAAWASYLEPWLPEAHYLSGLWAWRHGRRGEAR